VQRLEIEIALRKANAEMCIVGMVITVLSETTAAERNASSNSILSIRYVSPKYNRGGPLLMMRPTCRYRRQSTSRMVPKKLSIN